MSACASSEESLDKQNPPPHRTWEAYKGGKQASSYSALDQINRSNVDQLEVAWTYHTGDEGPTIECNPVIVDGVMYVTSPSIRVIALDAATGEELWAFDPFEGTNQYLGFSRGVVYWADGDDERILFTAGSMLYALDAETGRLISSFGNGGKVNMQKGLDRDVGDFPVRAFTPGIIYQDLLILGSAINDNPNPGIPPGHIRAYNTRTGEREWIFHTIPHPGEFGYETWPEDAWKEAGGANDWSGFSLDEERGLVFASTGSASFDHYGGFRQGKNLFANSVVALDAATGEYVWHFQAVHHDVWDYDLPCPPNLVTVEHDGERIDAVAQVTKMGHMFLLDRETGEPLFPVEERPVLQSEVPGEKTWPTQPFPVKPAPFARQGFDEEAITDRTPEAHAFVEQLYEQYGAHSLFTPPSVDGGIFLPQFNGGAEWGGASFDPATGRLYVNANNVPELMSMGEAPDNAKHPFPYIDTGKQPVTDPDGFPISKRPWGTLTAIDLNRGAIAWQVPMGTRLELEEQGLPPTGTFNIGGSIVTAGGLVFVGASKDERFHAYDKNTGELLWETELPAGGYATPSTYEVDDRQYVVIAAGGGGRLGTEQGDAFVAFALPANYAP